MKLQALVVCALLGGSAAKSFGDWFQIPPSASDDTTDRANQLIQRAERLSDVRADEARDAAVGALLVETDSVPASLLVAIAWGESRFIPTTVTGRACGLVQTIPDAHLSCEAMKVPIVGMLAGRLELEGWLRLARGDLHLALLAYACGFSAFDGSCAKQAWPGWVLARARRLGLDTRRSAAF